MATRILGGFRRDRRSTWGLGPPDLTLPSSLTSSMSPGCMAHRHGLIGLLGTGRRWGGWVKLAPRRVGGRGGIEGVGVDWALASPVAPVPLPGSLPWQSGHAAWSKHPLSGEKRKKTTAWRVGRCGAEDGGDKWDRARTVGALPGIMASRWPTEVQPWWTSAWQALALFWDVTLRDHLDTTQAANWRRPAVSGHLSTFCCAK